VLLWFGEGVDGVTPLLPVIAVDQVQTGRCSSCTLYWLPLRTVSCDPERENK